MWTADKLIYRDEDDFIRAYQGSELVWEKSIPNNTIYYTSTDGQVVTPSSTDFFGASIVSNTYTNNQGIILFDGPVTNIVEYVFFGETRLTSIILPSSVTGIGKRAFRITSITSVIIPSSVTNIGEGAFANTGLLCVIIPSSVTNISTGVFNYADLRSITIPSSVTSIDREICSYNVSLSSIEVDSNNQYYDSREGCNAIIETESDTLIQGCNNTIIPSSVTSIGVYAFLGSGLTSITIPSSVTDIGIEAFNYARSLSEVIVNSVVPPVLHSSATFDHNAPGRKIKVPAVSVEAYKTDTFWSYYAADIIAQD